MGRKCDTEEQVGTMYAMLVPLLKKTVTLVNWNLTDEVFPMFSYS